MAGLVLSVAEFYGPRRWRWLLAEEDTGRPLADHDVNLPEAGDEYGAFTDLYRYLRWNAVPDRRTASEAQMVAQVGAWAGQQVLGQAIGEAIVAAAPVTVRVAVPEQAGFLSGWPLELAYADGVPLASAGGRDVRVRPSPGPGSGGGRWAVGGSWRDGTAADAGGVQFADADQRTGAPARTIRAGAAGAADRGAAAAADRAGDRPVRGDPAEAGRDRRVRRWVGCAASVRARRPRPVPAGARPTDRRTRWTRAS